MHALFFTWNDSGGGMNWQRSATAGGNGNSPPGMRCSPGYQMNFGLYGTCDNINNVKSVCKQFNMLCSLLRLRIDDLSYDEEDGNSLCDLRDLFNSDLAVSCT